MYKFMYKVDAKRTRLQVVVSLSLLQEGFIQNLYAILLHS